MKFLLLKLRFSLCALTLLFSTTSHAQVSGQIIAEGDGSPIAGARVRIQADLSSPEATTDANGMFSLPINPTSQIGIAAYKPFVLQSGVQNFATNVEQVAGPGGGLTIALPRIPAHNAVGYQPPSSTSCAGCHGSQRSDWLTSRHAGAAVNPWVLDLFSGTGTPGGGAGYVFKNTHGVGESGFCATCHAPMQDVFAPGTVLLDQVSTPAGRDGVTCLACHQVAEVDPARINGLHHVNKTSYYFPDAGGLTTFHVFGALPDVGTDVMINMFNPLFKEARLCASCHQYNNPTTNAPGQSTYAEWLASPFAVAGPNFRTCQNCHMPEALSSGTIASGGVTRPAGQRHRHTFIGATASTLPAAIKLNVIPQIIGNELQVQAQVVNQGAGHSFPTGVSIRNAILVLEVKRGNALLAQSFGSTVPGYADDDVAGVQPGDLSGKPGKGFAKVLQGRINGQGAVQSPVLFIDAEGVLSSTTIPAGTTDTSTYRFTLPAGVAAGEVSISVRLLYRRAFRALAVTKGWTITPSGGPIEVEVAQVSINGEGLLRNGFE